MLPWKRRELYVGNSIQELNRIRDILDANHIPYDWKTGGEAASARNMAPRGEIAGRWGEGSESGAISYLYVSKDDFENAGRLVGKQERK